MEKSYAVYVIDREGYGGEAVFKASNKEAATRAAREYIRAWDLAPATIVSVRPV